MTSGDPSSAQTRSTDAATMHTAEYFRVPYKLEATSIELFDGNWIRQVSYPELPGCTVHAPTIEEALGALERQRFRVIAAIIRSSRKPPLPRPPLQSCDPLWLAEELEIKDELGDLLR